MTSGARKSARAMVRDYAALSGGELVSKILGFAAFAYLARVLDPEGYGALELAVALSMMGLLVVDFGMGPIGARDVTNRPERASALAREVPAARLLLALVAVGAMTVAALAIGDSPESRTLILCFGLGLSATPWTFNWLLQGQGRMTWVAPAQMIRMFVFLGAALVFVREPGHLVRVGAAEIAASFAVAGYYVWARRASLGHRSSVCCASQPRSERVSSCGH